MTPLLHYLVKPNLIFEIGCGTPDLTRTSAWIERGVSVEMFEPNFDSYTKLAAFFLKFPNVKIHPIALSDYVGETNLVVNGPSSFLEGTLAPTIHSGDDISGMARQTVAVHTLDMYDHGNVDMILIDAEGSEWKILSKMVSTPKVIAVEGHMGAYFTPDFDLLDKTLKSKGYIRLEIGGDCDTFYVHMNCVKFMIS